MEKGVVGFVQTLELPHNTPQLYREIMEAVRRHYRTLNYLNLSFVPPRRRWYDPVKRMIDLVFGVIGGLVLSPLFGIISLLIRIDSEGPAFYLQERVGRDGRRFKIYKFRTMVADAEKKTGPVWAKKDDPRLTRVGKVIRRLKLDELPQVINLIKGDMSLVGPRPERPPFVNLFAATIPGYTHRMSVKPGITGLAQIKNGYDKSAEDVIRKLRFDLAYIRRMCLILDFKLLGQTFLYLAKPA
jgi:lipopolysaccharide/colanic/teichoic acid biosynthesis glycosyltransferase